MNKIHSQSPFSIISIIFLLFATQFVSAQQHNATTSFRHAIPERAQTSFYDINCSSSSCYNKEALDQPETTYRLVMGPNSQAHLEFDYDEEKQIIINFDLDPNQSADFTVDVWSRDLSTKTLAIQAISESNPVPITLTASDKNELIISVSNSSPNNSATVNVKITYLDNKVEQDTFDWAVPLGAISGGIILLIILISISCIARSGTRHSRNRHPELPISLSQIQFQGKALSVKTDINGHFPETKFENLKSSFPQKECSICLEDLKENQICRQLDCQHIFHSECVELWLESQLLKKNMATCPNCKHQVLTINIKI